MASTATKDTDDAAAEAERRGKKREPARPLDCRPPAQICTVSDSNRGGNLLKVLVSEQLSRLVSTVKISFPTIL